MENEELLKKAKEAKSAEELLAIAKENGMELSEEEAAAYFAQLNKSGELSDDELDAVAGGGCHAKDGRLVVSMGYGCDEYVCKNCGSHAKGWHVCSANSTTRTRVVANDTCKSCRYCTYEKGLWLCNNPVNIK